MKSGLYSGTTAWCTILRALFTGRHRYAQIRAAVPGLSATLLADRRRSLEADGLVEHRVIRPHRCRWSTTCTGKGRDLEPVLDAVLSWAHRWIPLPDETHAPAG